MKHIVKMKGWPDHDIKLVFKEESAGQLGDWIIIFINGVKHGAITFNAEDRDKTKPTLKLWTAPILGSFGQTEDHRLIPEAVEDYKEAEDS